MSARPGADALEEHLPRSVTPVEAMPRRAPSATNAATSTESSPGLNSIAASWLWPKHRTTPARAGEVLATVFSSNLDEFFQVRVAGFKDQLAAGLSGTAPTACRCSTIKSHPHRSRGDAPGEQARIYNDVVVPRWPCAAAAWCLGARSARGHGLRRVRLRSPDVPS